MNNLGDHVLHDKDENKWYFRRHGELIGEDALRIMLAAIEAEKVVRK